MVKRPCEIRNPRMAWLSRPLTEVQQKKPFYVITAMLYLCNAIDEGDTFKEKLLALFKEYADVPIYKIGFFNRWGRGTDLEKDVRIESYGEEEEKTAGTLLPYLWRLQGEREIQRKGTHPAYLQELYVSHA